jgi:O-antigen ligase/tetratricopeptide (TPR) repeat protein
MADPRKKGSQRPLAPAVTAEAFAHKAITWWLPLLYFLISSLFYLRTYDSAQVKITVMQMGGVALLALWLSRLIEAGRSALSKDDLVCLSPFLAYLTVGILSFLHAPYHMASVDFFIRHCFYMTAALVVIYELDGRALDRLTGILVLTAWVAVSYGFLQWVDNTWFPGGVGKGIDPFVWRGAFGIRVFSTYGNPNFFADFLVIVFPILVMQFVKTRKFSLIVLMLMLLVDLITTGTKGAWVGFAFVVFLFGVVTMIYFKEAVAQYRKMILSLVVAGVLGFLGYVAKDLRTRVVSVNFRLFTWEAIWEAIMTHPFIGTGIGSFPPIYPAFRRPPIFHIEGKHNTETDHAENEYIEQLFDNGIIGFGVFLWMVLSTLVVGFRSLGQLTTTLSMKDGRPPPRALDLVGYMIAFMGMLGHNCFDVSMRFVSSGVYLGLLSGVIVNMARGKALYELHDARTGDAASPANSGGTGTMIAPEKTTWEAIIDYWKVLSEFLIWPARLLCWGALAYMAFKLARDFHGLQGPVRGMGGEVLQWYISWGTFAACVGALSLVFARLAALSENPAVALVIAVFLMPLNIFWGYFKADVHHNIAIFFSKERRWDEALHNYFMVEKLNPDFVMSMYFEGNVFNDRFDMRKIYNPAWGDKDNVARDDYERAMEAYDKVRRLAPNYVQHHHQVGALHMKRAQWAMQNGRPEEAELYMKRAMTRFKMYEQIDPVFPPNYFRMAEIQLMHKDYVGAAKTYEDFINAEKCAIAPSLISKPWLLNTILRYQPYVPLPEYPHHVHRHEQADAYTNLGNIYVWLERFPEAERAYRRALMLDSAYENAKKNLQAVYAKAQSIGRLRPVPPTEAQSAELVRTGWEVLPAKK